jgi:hypothetical protein
MASTTGMSLKYERMGQSIKATLYISIENYLKLLI